MYLCSFPLGPITYTNDGVTTIYGVAVAVGTYNTPQEPWHADQIIIRVAMPEILGWINEFKQKHSK